MGVGKSTVINALIGREIAPTSDLATSCTKNTQAYLSQVAKNLIVVDTPGFGDPTISTRNWIKDAQRVQNFDFDAIIYVINSTSRCSFELMVYTIVSKYLFQNYLHNRIIFFFTRCQTSGFTPQTGREYIQTLWTNCKFYAPLPEH